MCGATSESRLPALECAATVAISTPGCPASRRSVSPPAYPEAPTTATRGRRVVRSAGTAGAADGTAGAADGPAGTTPGSEDMTEVYTPNCMISHTPQHAITTRPPRTSGLRDEQRSPWSARPAASPRQPCTPSPTRLRASDPEAAGSITISTRPPTIDERSHVT